MKSESKHLRINEAKWDKWAASLDSNGWIGRRLRQAQEDVVSLLDIKEGTSFLDIGCGTGWAVGRAAELAAYRGLFYGVDLSSRMVEKAEGNFKGNDAVRFIRSDVESIPLEEGFFDMVICTNSFHHYLHPDRVLREVRRLLKYNGRFYLLDPAADNWFMKLVDLLGKLLEPAHVKLYSTEELQKLFNDTGLKYSVSEVSRTARKCQKVHVGEKIHQ